MLYGVGNAGTIVKYQNGVWKRIESGTDLQFLDIYGTTDSKTGEQQVLTVCTKDYYVIGSGIYEKKFLADSLWKNEPLDVTRYATTGIRGNNLNDVFVSGAFGEFLHFNGITWKSYINETGKFSGSYGGIAVKNNLVVTVSPPGKITSE